MNIPPIRFGRNGKQTITISENQLVLILAVAFIIVAILFAVLAAQYLTATGKSKRKPNEVAAVATATPPVFESSTQTPTPSGPTPTPPLPPGVEQVCMYQVKSGDWLVQILRDYNIQYQKNGSYFYRECALKDNVLQCGPQQAMQYPSYIYPGEWIEIPGVDQSTCATNTGQMAQVNK
jgi:hypothetical protein